MQTDTARRASEQATPRPNVLRYDLVTALLALGQHDRGSIGRLALRLALLITARFNWRSGSLAVGQREIARLWGVTERTAKREMAAMRDLGWITVRRAAARGRVTEHGLDLDRLAEATRSVWGVVGPDFEARMGAGQGVLVDAPPERGGAMIVPFPRAEVDVELADGCTLWPRAQALLRERDPGLYSAWFARLCLTRQEGARVTLTAPSAFVAGYVETHHRGRLLDVLRPLDHEIREIRVVPA